jgi:hypothetical protein
VKFPLSFTNKHPPEDSYVQYPEKACLYEFDEKYLVCSVAGIAETGSISLLDVSSDDEALGAAALKHLGEFEKESPLDLRDHKLTDWVAFQKSGAKSVKAFEEGLWHVDLATMNSAVLIWARPRKSLHHELAAYMTAGRLDAEGAGKAIRKAIEAAKALRDGGIV